MSRTILCVITAAVLAVVSLGLMVGRYVVLGDEVKVPGKPGTWKVTMLVHGRSSGEARVMTATPLDFGRQHLLREEFRSEELLNRTVEVKRPERRQVLWIQRAGVPDGPFRARCEFYCAVNVKDPSAPMTELSEQLYAPPRSGEYLMNEPGIESDHPAISALARRLTAGLQRPQDQAEALFRHVEQEIGNEPTVVGPPTGAVECLKNESGDAGAKSRLLAALCRNRGIPARLVTGLALAKGYEQTAHYWVEAWLREHWLPMCPFYKHFGRVPRTHLVFGIGDLPLVRGRNVRNLGYACLIDRLAGDGTEEAAPPSLARQVFTTLSLHGLPPAEQHLVEFLLLLPVAALIVCLFRNVIGIHSFGTFAPALLGLAFRNLTSLPGIAVFVAIILIGWGMRRVLDRYHLLQVPRSAFLLSLVVLLLIGAIVTANYCHLPATRYISLFPMVILTAMIERFWTLEVEDGTGSSFRTLLGTILIACCISLVLSLHAVQRHLFRYPETLGLIMAAQLLIGRYTGYRLSELYRFRDFTQSPETHPPLAA
jgi:hypothetical protein